MRKIIKVFIVAGLILILGYLVFRIGCEYQTKKETETRIQTLPNAVFYSLTGDSVNLHSYDQSKSLVIIYFHPDCEHCEYEAQEIAQNTNKFKNCQLLMIAADDSIKLIENFCSKFNLLKVVELEVLLDCHYQFEEIFGTAIIPSVFIYDTERKLKRKFLGETKLDAILAEI